MRLPDSELSGVPTCLYGGASGAVGLVASLPRELYDLLAALQCGLKKVRAGVSCVPLLLLRACVWELAWAAARTTDASDALRIARRHPSAPCPGHPGRGRL
jgi:hypothetical protein